MKKIKDNILVVVAHPDDEVLGCGGTILKLSKKNNIFLSILSDGVSSRTKYKNKILDEKIKERRINAIKSSKILGIKDVFFHNLQDNNFGQENFLKIVKHIENLISKIKPKTIFTHFSYDLNIDHQITSSAVITASRPQKSQPVKKIFNFFIPSSTDWNFSNSQNVFNPNWFEDTEKYYHKKIKALKQYKNELRKSPHPRSLENINNVEKVNGHRVGLNRAEAFILIRNIQ